MAAHQLLAWLLSLVLVAAAGHLFCSRRRPGAVVVNAAPLDGHRRARGGLLGGPAAAAAASARNPRQRSGRARGAEYLGSLLSDVTASDAHRYNLKVSRRAAPVHTPVLPAGATNVRGATRHLPLPSQHRLHSIQHRVLGKAWPLGVMCVCVCACVCVCLPARVASACSSVHFSLPPSL